MNPTFVLLLFLANCCQLCSAVEETASSSTLYSSSQTSSAWSQESTSSLESTPSLETTSITSSSLSSSSWDWGWDEETASSSSVVSTTSTYSGWSKLSSTSSAESDWIPTPISSTIMSSSSIPSIETLFVYMYEALERDHLGKRRKRRELKTPGVLQKSKRDFREDKQSQLMKRKALGLKSKDFIKEMLQRALKKRSS
ncbi:uncharacterized protein LOC144631624 [Oculina patagonica]